MLDVAFYRDDIGIRPVLPEAVTDIPGDLSGMTVVLVDDVLFTGRTIRAALNALARLRPVPATVQLAVMVDQEATVRCHIRPDYVRQEPSHPVRRAGRREPRGCGARRRGAAVMSTSSEARRSPETTASAPAVSGSPAPEGRPGGTPRPAAPRHLLSMADLDRAGVEQILRLSDHFAEVGRRAIPKVPALRGRTVVSLFAEESTRTRFSFETAARRLSADVLTFSPSSSSVKKGESLRDTVQTCWWRAAWAADALPSPCWLQPLRRTCWSQWVDASVVNAGDGWHEHPTQALVDCFTMREELARRAGRPVPDTGVEAFEGLRVAIVGDIAHSRVARSEVLALATLGARVTLVAPGSLLPSSLAGWPVANVCHDLDSALEEADVCYLLRLQTERGAGSHLPSLREYTSGFGLTARRLQRLPTEAFVMHPGPMNRGVEIAADVADLPRSVVLRQVTNGVAVRMAVLFLLLSGGATSMLAGTGAPTGGGDDDHRAGVGDAAGPARPGPR